MAGKVEEAGDFIIRLPEVMRRTGLRHTSIYEHMKEGSFPQAVPLGGRAVGWVEREILQWVADRIAARGQAVSR